MFHKYLDQASKRFKEHPNVAAIYTCLPEDKADRPAWDQSANHHIKVQDFAYNQHDSELNTSDFIADFTTFGFQSRHRRVNNGDLLSKAGYLGYEKVDRILRDIPDDLKARFPSFFGMRCYPPQCQAPSASPTVAATTMDSVSSSDLSGTTDTPSIATNASQERPGKEAKNRRPRGIRHNELLLAVAATIVEYMS